MWLATKRGTEKIGELQMLPERLLMNENRLSNKKQTWRSGRTCSPVAEDGEVCNLDRTGY